MTSTLRRSAPLVVVAGAVLGVALFITQPWGGGQAEGSLIKYRLCNTVLEAPPIPDPPGKNKVVTAARHIEVEVEVKDGVVQSVELIPTLEIWLKELTKGERFQVSIDPMNATLMEGQTVRTEMLPILNTVRHEQLDRSTAPWPYTNNGRPTEQEKMGSFKILRPDPASGILVSLIRGIGDGFHAHTLEVANCQSVMYITAEFLEGVSEVEPAVDTEFVQPEDRAAFDAFFQAIDSKAVLGP